MYNTKSYWENRYKGGGDSGFGSHNAISVKFKADFVNELIDEFKMFKTYIKDLFNLSDLICIFSTNIYEKYVLNSHGKHRKILPYIQKTHPNFSLIKKDKYLKDHEKDTLSFFVFKKQYDE